MPVTAVVFDMGGVLVNLGPLTEILGPESPLTDEEFWPKWLASPTVRLFETGGCTAQHFGERLVEDLGLSMTPDELVDRFAAWPKGLFAGAEELVRQTSAVVDTALLSNTNQLHWENQTDAAAMTMLCERNYLSYELGILKPDAAIYAHVVADLDRPADEVLFLDDNQINVDAAREAGLRSERTRGVAEARSAVEAHGLSLG